MRLSDKNAQKYYLTEAAANNLSVRTLEVGTYQPFSISDRTPQKARQVNAQQSCVDEKCATP
jgi:hypothetical protein